MPHGQCSHDSTHTAPTWKVTHRNPIHPRSSNFLDGSQTRLLFTPGSSAEPRGRPLKAGLGPPLSEHCAQPLPDCAQLRAENSAARPRQPQCCWMLVDPGLSSALLGPKLRSVTGSHALPGPPLPGTGGLKCGIQ